jgi:hypothetical protein
LLFDASIDLQSEKNIFDVGFQPKGIDGTLQYGAMRGFGLDFVLSAIDAAEKLRSVILPVAFFDGYHLLALIGDLRNLEKKYGPEKIDVRVLHKLMELFLLGFEGLVLQLRWCIAASGRLDLAEEIPLETLRSPLLPTEPIQNISTAFRVLGESGNYEVFSIGIPGAKSSKVHTYDTGSRLVYMDELDKIQVDAKVK